MSELDCRDGAAKTYRHGTHRACGPLETLARVEPLLDRFGITRIANLTGLDRAGIPVVMVCRPNARSSAVFHGKGLDLVAAKASGVMEAIETWHAETIQLPLRHGSIADLCSRFRLADVDRLPSLAGRRLQDTQPLFWVEASDLADGGPVWVPFEVIHADSTLAALPRSGCFATSTNGLASGNHRLEAISHALCEVIERDATSLWHARPARDRQGRRLDLASVDSPAIRRLLDCLDTRSFEVAVWDTTTDIGVSAFQCVVRDRTEEIAHLGSGAGCHPTREIALLRAITEAVQVRTTYIVGSREDIVHADYLSATLRARAQWADTLFAPEAGSREYSAVPSTAFDDFGREVGWVVDRLANVGLDQVLIVDLTREDIGIPVVRAVVPGLDGSSHHPGYVPGSRARAMLGV